MRIALVSVYNYDSNVEGYNYTHLYDLLKERKPEESISHKGMPTFADHIKFVESKPYQCWYLIQDLDDYKVVGCVYLTVAGEIGISIYDKYRRKGYATEAVKAIMELHPKPEFYANINPYNVKSVKFFEELGFVFYTYTAKEPKQDTYIFIPSDELSGE